MHEIISAIAAGLTVAGLTKLFGWNGGLSRVVISNSNRASATSKIFIMGWLGFWWGIVYTFSWIAAAGFSSPRAGIGLAVLFFLHL